jgi:hypothetical protein
LRDKYKQGKTGSAQHRTPWDKQLGRSIKRPAPIVNQNNIDGLQWGEGEVARGVCLCEVAGKIIDCGISTQVSEVRFQSVFLGNFFCKGKLFPWIPAFAGMTDFCKLSSWRKVGFGVLGRLVYVVDRFFLNDVIPSITRHLEAFFKMTFSDFSASPRNDKLKNYFFAKENS